MRVCGASVMGRACCRITHILTSTRSNRRRGVTGVVASPKVGTQISTALTTLHCRCRRAGQQTLSRPRLASEVFGANGGATDMADPRNYQFDLPANSRPSDVSLNEPWYPGIQAFWDRCTSSRIFDAILGIKAVVIHATAGSSSAGAVSVMRDGKASFHWLVPDENEAQHGVLVWAC